MGKIEVQTRPLEVGDLVTVDVSDYIPNSSRNGELGFIKGLEPTGDPRIIQYTLILTSESGVNPAIFYNFELRRVS